MVIPLTSQGPRPPHLPPYQRQGPEGAGRRERGHQDPPDRHGHRQQGGQGQGGQAGQRQRQWEGGVLQDGQGVALSGVGGLSQVRSEVNIPRWSGGS